MKDILFTPIEYLKGVGPQKSDLLKTELSIFTFRDLLYHLPYRYIDRTKIYTVAEVQSAEAFVQLKGKIIQKQLIGQQRKQRLVATLQDHTGSIELVWFKGIKWVDKLITLGHEYLIFGKPNLFNNTLNIPHPELEIYNPDKPAYNNLQPVYNTTEKLTNAHLDSKGILALQRNLAEQLFHKLPENLSAELIQKMRFMLHSEAMHKIHFPNTNTDISEARRRLVFEDIFFHQLKLLRHKYTLKKTVNGKPLQKVDLLNDFYKNHLPFELTQAQKRVIKEIYSDFCSGKQMNRLLQGDVGSGKTIVAFICMLIAAGNDGQACIMAPTEILAEQHFNGLKPFCDEMGLEIALLTGSTKTKKRTEILEKLRTGELHFIVGTHTLIEDVVVFKELNLCIIDEQHRFGVEQRAKLSQKNPYFKPHILVMTATPIPRTLAMSFYGDLDTSVIDEMPQGRKPIITVHRFEDKRLAVFGFIKEQLKQGRQIYIVYPLVEESEKLDLNNLTEGFESINRVFNPEYQVGILYGKMASDRKEMEMNRFVKKETQILVATTVIEVGINVPNASVMVIENSERFGLAQLHQLRGRVGRGADQSYCILMSGYKLSTEARTRIETMVRTNNGFEIADTDLQLRGPGDIMGKRQSGALDLKVANLATDGNVIKEARTIIQEMLDSDPDLLKPQYSPIKHYADTFYKNDVFGRVG